MNQQITINGVGIHSGKPSSILIRPHDHGVLFNVEGTPIPALIQHVKDTQRATTISVGDRSLRTIEHLCSAIYGLNLSGAEITVTGGEIPILDGSAMPFIEALADTLTTESQNEPLTIDRTITHRNPDNGAFIRIEPSQDFHVTYTQRFQKRAIDTFSFLSSPKNYIKEIASARTFAYAGELQLLYRKGFIRGLDPNAGFIILDSEPNWDLMEEIIGEDARSAVHETPFYKILSKIPPRYPNEATRHKVLDILGDFSLLGMPIKGLITADGTGHSENIALIQKIAETYGLIHFDPLGDDE